MRASRRWSTKCSCKALNQHLHGQPAGRHLRHASRARGARQDRGDRPIADRPHAALQSGHVHRRVRSDSRTVFAHARSEAARLHARDASRSTSRAAAANRAKATASSRSRCTSCPTSTCRAKSAKASAITRRRSRSSTRGSRSPTCSRCASTKRPSSSARSPASTAGSRRSPTSASATSRWVSPPRTLSGGEASASNSRRNSRKRATGRTFYVLDEPTTGLHFADIHKLLEVLQRLVDAGNTVLVDRAQPRRDQDGRLHDRPRTRRAATAAARSWRRGPPKRSRKVKGSFTGSYLGPVLKDERAHGMIRPNRSMSRRSNARTSRACTNSLRTSESPSRPRS